MYKKSVSYVHAILTLSFAFLLAPNTMAQETFLALDMDKYIGQVAQNYAYNPTSYSLLTYCNELQKSALPVFKEKFRAYDKALRFNDSVRYLLQSKEYYFNWWYLHIRSKEKYALKNKYAHWQDKNELRFKLGDLTITEYLELKNRFEAISDNYNLETDQLFIAEWELKKYSLLGNYQLVPASETYGTYEIKKYHQAYTAKLRLAVYENEIELLNYMSTHIKKSVFNNAGAELLRTEIQAIVRLKQQSLTIFQEQVFNEKELLKVQLTSNFVELKSFENQKLPEAIAIEQTASIRFEKEEIDYTQYLMELNRVSTIRIQYLNLLHNYNTTALQLEYYAY